MAMVDKLPCDELSEASGRTRWDDYITMLSLANFNFAHPVSPENPLPTRDPCRAKKIAQTLTVAKLSLSFTR